MTGGGGGSEPLPEPAREPVPAVRHAFSATSDGAESPLVSCLCVTEGRAQFWPWLWWNFTKQDHARRELVIVDSSPEPIAAGDPRVRVVTAAPGASVAAKRNLAVRAARGRLVAWFDDDDWQHPRRLSILVRALASGGRLAGATESWFVDPVGRRARAYRSQLDVIFNGLAVPLADLAGLPFDEPKLRAADTSWVRELSRRAGEGVVAVPEVLSWWLCHRRNLSNPVTKYIFPQALDVVRARIGEPDWADTDDHLAALVYRLSPP
jgi:glycosyltransferase involved in cell wall biosynthesis